MSIYFGVWKLRRVVAFLEMEERGEIRLCPPRKTADIRRDLNYARRTLRIWERS